MYSPYTSVVLGLLESELKMRQKMTKIIQHGYTKKNPSHIPESLLSGWGMGEEGGQNLQTSLVRS